MQNLFYTSPHDQSLAEQLLPIGSYGQEPILNVCKLGRLQNDAAKSRLGHGFLQIGWWVGPSGNRAVFLRKFMKQSNLYFLLRCGSNTPWVDSALQSTFTSSQVLEEMERVILCPGGGLWSGGFWKTLMILHFELTAQIPLTASVCLVTEYYSESCGGVLKIENRSVLMDMMTQWVTLLASDKCRTLEYSVVCSSDIDQ